ncbi:hypothetical protein FKM82_024239 [Ascaphus truei]
MKNVLYFLFCRVTWGLVTTSCLNFSKQNVTFNATNFVYVLYWHRMDLTPDAVFNVQYKRYGDEDWSVKLECQNITRLYCSLTHEIIDEVDEFMEHQYYGKVMAVTKNCTSEWAISKRFSPKENIHIGQPEVKYVRDVHSITILVHAPSVPMKSKDGQQQKSKDTYIHSYLEYYMSLSNLKDDVIWQQTQVDNKFEVTGLKPNTKYNGSVYIMIHKERKSEIQDFVVKTLPDHSLITLVMCGVAVSACLLGAGLVYTSYRYVRRQRPMPESLDFGKNPTFRPMNPRIGANSSLNDLSNLVHFTPTLSVRPQEQNFKTLPEQPQNPGEAVYKTQFQHHPGTRQVDPTLHTQSSYCPQEKDATANNNKGTPVVYGVCEKSTASETSYLPNPNSKKILMGNESNPYQAQTGVPLGIRNLVGTVSDYNGERPEKMEELNGPLMLNVKRQYGHPRLLFPFCSEEPMWISATGMSYGLQRLLSSVKVCDGMGSGGQMERAQEQSVTLLSDLSDRDRFPDNQPEEQVLEDSLSHYAGKQHTFQCLLKDLPADSLERTQKCQDFPQTQYLPADVDETPKMTVYR